MDLKVEDLAWYVGNAQQDENTLQFLASCIAEASELVDKYVGSMDVPEATLDRCVKEVAADLYYRKAAPSGITQFATETGMGAQRIARDPMRSIADILRHVLGPAIG